MLAFAAAAPAPADPAQFSSVIEDLPLMAGLVEEPSAPFETDAGRIVWLEAVGEVRASAVERFYRETLPALGWNEVSGSDELAFARADERLVVRIESPTRESSRVTFLITPADAAGSR